MTLTGGANSSISHNSQDLPFSLKPRKPFLACVDSVGRGALPSESASEGVLVASAEPPPVHERLKRLGRHVSPSHNAEADL